MKIFDVEITPEDVHALLNFIQAHRNRKKDEICLTLEFTLANIKGWYLHFVRVFSPEITRQISGKSFEETGQISDEITRFINRNEAIQASSDSEDYLRELERDYYANRLKSSLVHKINLRTLHELMNRIILFRDWATDVKGRWIRTAIEKRRWDVSPDEIQRTIEILKNYTEEIRGFVRSMQKEIECNSENTKKFCQQLRNSN